MSERKIVDYWIKSAEEDLLTAESLLKEKRYLHCLFFCHLFLEKILKAVFIARKHTAPPWIHDLLKLAGESDIELEENSKKDLREISRFNITARYDDYKFSMYKKASHEFTQKYFSKTKEIYLCFRKLI
ncbi:HEPN domain-containing protein [Candidatus Gottesmanbacteria bacterium]|nr:HEPN domain-containing protein [Candidatus Gottesmanbacteria bacterium]